MTKQEARIRNEIRERLIKYLYTSWNMPIYYIEIPFENWHEIFKTEECQKTLKK